MIKYARDSGKTSAGVEVSLNKAGTSAIPAPVIRIPSNKVAVMAVWTVLRTSLLFPAPKCWETTTPAPLESPKKADDHVDDRTDRTDRRKSFIADEVADDPCVDGIV